MHHVRAELAGQFDGFLAIGGLADDLVTIVFEHGHQIHTIHGLVLGHDNGTRAVLGLGFALSRLAVFLGHSLEFFVGQHLVDVDARFLGLLPCSHATLFSDCDQIQMTPRDSRRSLFESDLFAKVPSVGLEPTLRRF